MGFLHKEFLDIETSSNTTENSKKIKDTERRRNERTQDSDDFLSCDDSCDGNSMYFASTSPTDFEFTEDDDASNIFNGRDSETQSSAENTFHIETFGDTNERNRLLKIFCCVDCDTHLSTGDDIISKAFQGQKGKAYLFNRVVNVIEGDSEDRSMTTGKHTVCDIYCSDCNNCIGWKYIKAFEGSQKYKEGKFILERKLLTVISFTKK